MKLFKATAMALVAGTAFALVASQALAQDNSSSTATTSINGNSDAVILSTGISSTQIDATHTSGGAIAAAIATPIFTASGGASFPGGTLSGTGPESSNNIQPSGPGTGGSQYGAPGQLGVLDGGSFNASLDNGESDTFALNHVALWLDVAAAETQGSATTSNTSSTGVSVAGLFVFGQTTAVGPGSTLTDQTEFAPEADISNAFTADNGNIALNQVAGVGNQQGNNLSTLLEVTGDNGTTAGSNSVNVEGNQTIANAGLITDGTTTGGESVNIFGGAFNADNGAIAFNQAAGVGNQQANNITLAH